MPSFYTGEFFMTDQEVQRSLRLVRYGGVVITVTVFIVLLAFALVAGQAIDRTNPTAGAATAATFNSFLPYIVGFTILAAVLSAALWFGYRAYLTRAKTTTTT
jgi:Mn2+/Fe2+ NRAMP family transporter